MNISNQIELRLKIMSENLKRNDFFIKLDCSMSEPQLLLQAAQNTSPPLHQGVAKDGGVHGP